MPENALTWQTVKAPDGQSFRIPVPFLCHVSKDHGEAKYGWKNKWWCSECYIAEQTLMIKCNPCNGTGDDLIGGGACGNCAGTGEVLTKVSK